MEKEKRTKEKPKKAGLPRTEKELEQIGEITDFLAQAFCADGGCQYVEGVKVLSTIWNLNTSMLFALQDSRRGKFFVTLSK